MKYLILKHKKILCYILIYHQLTLRKNHSTKPTAPLGNYIIRIKYKDCKPSMTIIYNHLKQNL